MLDMAHDMTTLPRMFLALSAVTALACASPAGAQSLPWAATPAPPQHAVPPPHAADNEQPPPPPSSRMPPQELPMLVPQPTRTIEPTGAGRVLVQAGVGALATAGGGFLGALAGIPFALAGSRGERGFFALVYLGASLATAAAVTGVGRGFDGDGNFGAALGGAVAGGLAGWGIQYWLFDSPTAERTYAAPMLITGLLITAGAVTGYALSNSTAEEIAEARGTRQARLRLLPSVEPLRDGAVFGVAGAL